MRGQEEERVTSQVSMLVVLGGLALSTSRLHWFGKLIYMCPIFREIRQNTSLVFNVLVSKLICNFIKNTTFGTHVNILGCFDKNDFLAFVTQPFSRNCFHIKVKT